MGRAFADLSSPKILLIDDHEMIISGFKALCASLDKPILVVSATSLEEGISVFGRTQGIDLCLLDLGMPGLSGIEAFVQFKRACPQAHDCPGAAACRRILQARCPRHSGKPSAIDVAGILHALALTRSPTNSSSSSQRISL